MADERTRARASQAPPEETAAGTEAAQNQAEAILEDSDRRQGDREAAPGSVVEHRRSGETIVPPE